MDVKEFLKKLDLRDNVKKTDDVELRQMAEKYGIATEFGNVNFSSATRNRSAAVTVYIGGSNVRQQKLTERRKHIFDNAIGTIKEVNAYIERAPLALVERNIGDNPVFSPFCRLYVSLHRKDNVRLPYMWSKTLFKPNRALNGPELNLIYVPEWPENKRQVLVLPEEGVTYVLGTDYFGEAKKGHLRMAMWFAKKSGMLGLHAGSKIIKARDKKGDLKKLGALLFGLSATGKTTHACHNHGLTGEGEGVEIVQDDVVLWQKDGAAFGTEKGFFIKTDGLEPNAQALLYNAAIKKDAIFENIMVDYAGNVDFNSDVLTGNGRGIIQMADLAPFASKSVNLPPLDQLDGLIIAFITRRNTVLPIASKLSPEQAAIAFMLGESIETSAGDPQKAGESVRVVGTNPFIIGDECEEGNRFYEFIKAGKGKIQCYLLNTGGVGEIIETGNNGVKEIKQKVTRVEIPEMASIIREIARDNIEWIKDSNFGTLVPKNVEGADMERFNLAKFYTQDQIDALIVKLKNERKEYMKNFGDLNPEILKCLS